MNVDHILDTLNKGGVRYLLIGGMNVFFRHQSVLTYDVDLWIEDERGNRERCENALVQLDASWGKTDESWGLVSRLKTGWLEWQSVFCMSSPHGSIDIFRTVRGLESWSTSYELSVDGRTSSGIPFRALSDEDMLKCQLALAPAEQKLARIEMLQKAMGKTHG